MSGVTREVGSWTERDSQDNSTATATRAAPSGGLRHFITGVSGTFDSSVSGVSLTLKEGSTIVARWYVFDVFAQSFVSPIMLSPGTAANLELAASGSAGVVGDVNLHGYTL